MKLGKQAATSDHRDLKFAAYLAPKATLPTPPASFGHERGITWGMLGNADYGDCVFAGGDHEQMIFALEGRGQHVAFSDHTALADYGAVTGFDPATGANDNGTNVRDAMKYRKAHGLADVTGKRHKIAAYLSIEPGNVQHIVLAAYLFGAVGIGVEFPQSAMDQFNAGKPWSVVKGSPIDGGHYIPIVARRGSRPQIVTWGREQAVTTGFLKTYCDEAWVPVSSEIFNASGITPEGFNLSQLTADLAGL